METLLIELARLHGISEAAERSNHGMTAVPPAARSRVNAWAERNRKAAQ